jgi:hypothetical protein
MYEEARVGASGRIILDGSVCRVIRPYSILDLRARRLICDPIYDGSLIIAWFYLDHRDDWSGSVLDGSRLGICGGLYPAKLESQYQEYRHSDDQDYQRRQENRIGVSEDLLRLVYDSIDR